MDPSLSLTLSHSSSTDIPYRRPPSSSDLIVSTGVGVLTRDPVRGGLWGPVELTLLLVNLPNTVVSSDPDVSQGLSPPDLPGLLDGKTVQGFTTTTMSTVPTPWYDVTDLEVN